MCLECIFDISHIIFCHFVAMKKSKFMGRVRALCMGSYRASPCGRVRGGHDEAQRSTRKVPRVVC